MATNRLATDLAALSDTELHAVLAQREELHVQQDEELARRVVANVQAIFAGANYCHIPQPLGLVKYAGALCSEGGGMVPDMPRGSAVYVIASRGLHVPAWCGQSGTGRARLKDHATYEPKGPYNGDSYLIHALRSNFPETDWHHEMFYALTIPIPFGAETTRLRVETKLAGAIHCRSATWRTFPQRQYEAARAAIKDPKAEFTRFAVQLADLQKRAA